MHVLIISRGIPDNCYPLFGIFEFDQAKALVKYGLQVTFFAIDLRSIRHGRRPGIRSFVKDGVNCHVFSVPVGAVPGTILHGIGIWALRILYHKVFTDTKPDILHAHFTNSGYIAAMLAEEEHIPLVITEHSSTMNRDKISASLLQTARFAYSNADAVIAVGNGLAKSIEDKTGVSCTVIPNIMAGDAFYRCERSEHENHYGFVFTGSLIERKRPLLLLEAFEKIHRTNPGARLGIVGDGPLRPRLEQRIAQMGLEDCVKLYGRLSRDQIAEIYKDYDCFALPSASETFGVVYIEALAAGLPVIATRCGGPEDFVGPELGLLIPVDDQTALENAMEHMLHSAGQYDAGQLKRFVRERFSDCAVAERLCAVYTDCLNKRNAPQK